MTSPVLNFKTPEQSIREIQSIDRNVLAQTLITSPSDCIAMIDYLNSQRTIVGMDINKLDEQITKLRAILDLKINLTAHVLGINGNTHAFVSENQLQTKIDFIPKEEKKVEIPVQEKETKVIKMVPKIEKVKEEIVHTVKTKPIENEERGLIGEYEDEKQKTILTSNSTYHLNKTAIQQIASVETAETVEEKPLTSSELEKEALEQLSNNEAPGKVASFFFKKGKNLADVPNGTKSLGTMWKKVLELWKGKAHDQAIEATTVEQPPVQEIEVSVELKQPAEKKSEAELDLERKEIEYAAKDIIIRSFSDRTINAKNEVAKLFKSTGAKKLFKGDLDKRYGSWRMDVVRDNPSLVEDRKEEKSAPKILFKPINIEEKHPDVWESAIHCANLNEFKSLITTIVFEKTKELPNGWIVAANLVNQYINKFDEAKDFTEDNKHDWFVDLVKTVKEERSKTKQLIENQVTEPIQTVEEKKEENPVVVETKPVETEVKKKPIDLPKYNDIKNESNKGKLSQLCGNFLLETSYKTLEERKTELIGLLKENDRYRKINDSEINNYINKLGRTNGAIGKLK